MQDRHPCHCIVPPYMLEKLTQSSDVNIRASALEALTFSSIALGARNVRAEAPMMSAIPSIAGARERRVYDANHRPYYYLPGELKRAEGDAATNDVAVDEAYDYSGVVYDFYKKVFHRNSLDGRGMALVSSVHVGNRFNNAFWNGEQMAYGDGDTQIFGRFTQSLEVVAHELTHGVVTHTSNLEYINESGALNEHFADVFGVLVKQWHQNQDVNAADWLVGAGIMVPAEDRPTTFALRTFEDKLAYENDPYLGDDPQPKHMKNKYTGTADYGGVHINSGIPNHAFFLAAKQIGGNAWERVGRIWFDAMRALNPLSQFQDAVNATDAAAHQRFGAGSLEQAAVADAWKQVGL